MAPRTPPPRHHSSTGRPYRRSAARELAALLVLVLVLLAVGCSSDGRDLAAPSSWQTTTTRPPPPTSAPDQEIGESGLTLTSPAFAPGGDIPESATCNGDNVFPALSWTGTSPQAVELAVTLSDQTNPDEPLLLWLMAGIDPALEGLEPGTLPIGAFETLNDYGNPGYGTPCLETFAAGARDLQFRLHVMTQPSGVAPGDPGNEAWASIKAQSTESASLLARIVSQG